MRERAARGGRPGPGAAEPPVATGPPGPLWCRPDPRGTRGGLSLSEPLLPALSPAQLVGYVALVLGISGFLQRDDRRLKLLIAAESVAYVVHFALLGAPPAAASAAVSAVRMGLSIRWRSAWLAVAAVAANLALAVAVSTHGPGWLPVVGGALGAIAVFTLSGVPMRLVMLGSTACWLANNVLTGSLGGTVLEALIGAASVSTIVRMTLAARSSGEEAEGALS